MQCYVPCVAHKKSQKNKIKSAFAVILVIFVFMFLFVFLVAMKKKIVCFEKQDFYLVSACQSKKEALCLEKKDLVKDLGGAGVVCFVKERYRLVVNAYLSKDDANEVAGKIKESFTETEVIKLSAKEISRKNAERFRKETSVYRFFKKKQAFFKEFLELEMKYLKGDISNGQMISQLISKKLEFETLLKEIESFNKKEGFLILRDGLNAFVLEFEKLFDSFFESRKKQSLICEFYVNLVKMNVQMCEKL